MVRTVAAIAQLGEHARGFCHVEPSGQKLELVTEQWATDYLAQDRISDEGAPLALSR